MKKIALILLVAVCSICAVSALDAQVKNVTGKVEVQKDGSWVPLKEGDVLAKGAMVSTGFKSSADLKINDAIVTLGPLTRMTVQQLVEDNTIDETSLFMDSGSVKADINRESGKRVNFKISSPVATASVRGTTLTMRGNTVTCSNGSVSVEPSTSAEAVINESEVPSTSNVPVEGVSTANTRATDLGGTDNGTVISAGQSTKLDSRTNSVESPQVALASATRITETVTKTLASQESAVSAVAASVASTALDVPKETETPSAGVSISVSWGD